MIPMPIKPTRPVAENPISSAASYASQVLAGINGGQGIAPSPYIRTPQGGSQGALPARTVGDRQQMISEGASRQHQQTLSRLQGARRQVSALSVPAGNGKAAPAPRGGYSGAFSGGVHGLTPNAGAALQRLQAAYQQRFNQPLSVLSGGRSHEDQARAYAAYKAGRGNLAAPPGSSVHESGRAVDFGGAAHGYSPQQTWLVQNGPKFGWLWAGKNFSQVEPWHFEFQG